MQVRREARVLEAEGLFVAAREVEGTAQLVGVAREAAAKEERVRWAVHTTNEY